MDLPLNMRRIGGASFSEIEPCLGRTETDRFRRDLNAVTWLPRLQNLSAQTLQILPPPFTLTSLPFKHVLGLGQDQRIRTTRPPGDVLNLKLVRVDPAVNVQSLLLVDGPLEPLHRSIGEELIQLLTGGLLSCTLD